jgi:ATP-dependent RNA helicase RhlE
VKLLAGNGIAANAIHGNKSQPQRERALAEFKGGKVKILIATDIAARGIDVTGVSHVINFELPERAEQYVHRIGRTARAGAAGVAIAIAPRTSGRTSRASRSSPSRRSISCRCRRISCARRIGSRRPAPGRQSWSAKSAPAAPPVPPSASAPARPARPAAAASAAAATTAAPLRRHGKQLSLSLEGRGY